MALKGEQDFILDCSSGFFVWEQLINISRLALSPAK